jgi:sugar fermentation stimulation protein A
MLLQTPYQIGTLLKRYKRFLVDIDFPGSETITGHAANTGSMETCLKIGQPALLTYHDSPSRKLKWSLQALKWDDTWIGVHTPNANALAREGIEQGIIEELAGYNSIRPETTFGESRFDFFLSDHKHCAVDCFVEVKNVTLKGPDDLAMFPDSPSTRGQKHLDELCRVVQAGMRGVMLYIVQREDVHAFTPALMHDPIYAQKLRQARLCGVEILVYQASIRPPEIRLERPLPWFFLTEDGEFETI